MLNLLLRWMLRTTDPLRYSMENSNSDWDMDWNLALGFFLGIVASGIAAVIYERATSPRIEISLDQRPLAFGQGRDRPPHAFYHLLIRNIPPRLPLISRKPAWSSKATIQVFNRDGTPAIADPIYARWPSQPEPLIPTMMGNRSVNLIDFARMMNARKVDIHAHEDEYITLALKFDGQPEFYIFSNESYLHDWCNPAWRLDKGDYRVLITVFYERGSTQREFIMRNPRNARNSLEIEYAKD